MSIRERGLYDHCGARPLSAPNDLVFDRHGGFYFTDTGKARANDRTHGGVYDARADGSHIVEIAHPVVTPNGIGLSPDGRIFYYADMEPGRIWAFDVLELGVVKKLPFPSPHGARLLFGAAGFQRFDSLAVSVSGNVCVGTLAAGCITVIAPDGSLERQVRMPDLYPTNLCFGGPDRRTAFITLSLTGKLVPMPWPESGLPLAYEI